MVRHGAKGSIERLAKGFCFLMINGEAAFVGWYNSRLEGEFT